MIKMRKNLRIQEISYKKDYKNFLTGIKVKNKIKILEVILMMMINWEQK